MGQRFNNAGSMVYLALKESRRKVFDSMTTPQQNGGFSFPFSPHMAEIPSNPIFHLLPKLNDPSFVCFFAGVPSPDSYPYKDVERIASELLASSPRALLQYGSTEGYAPMRASFARFLARYGLDARPKEIMATTGGQQGIELLCKLFVEPGDAVLVEAPTYSATLQILKSHRARACSLESDGEGVLPGDLEEKIIRLRPKFVYLIPTFKNPSGETMSAARRAAAAEITGRLGVMLVEDDPYRDLRYEGDDLPAIKSLDRAGNVVFLTSTSKILCPGLRVGAVYAREDLMPKLTVAKQAADMHSATLPQAIVAEYLDRGLLDEHIKSVCRMYRSRQRAMLGAIERHFPGDIKWTKPQGGLFVWCVCPPRVDVGALLDRAIERQVGFVPGDQFFAEACNGSDGESGSGAVGNAKNTFRLNFSCESEASIERGVAILGELLKETA
jgi:2-aminoadipate transaminase